MPIGSVEFEMGSLIQKLRDIAPEVHKSMKTLVKESSVIAVRKAVEMTPPGEADMSAQQAKKRGESAIAVDLFGGTRGKDSHRAGIFFAVKSAIIARFKNEGPVKSRATSIFGDYEVLFHNKAGQIYATKNQFYRPNASLSEMAAHHRRYFRKGKMTSSRSELVTTGQHVFVDRFVTTTENLKAFYRQQILKVGIWAAGWMPAVEKLKVSRIPGWVKRHSALAKGSCDIQDNGYSFFIEASNRTGFGDLSRILPYAIAGAKQAMLAQIPHLKKRALAKAGFKTTT